MKKFRKLAFDAGHGGKDPGAVNSSININESDVVLDVAKMLRRRFTAPWRRKKLIRSKDVFVELNERWQIVNKWGADVCFSIHCNSTTDKTVRGCEVFYNDSGIEKKLARRIAKSVSSELDIPNRGAKKYDWAMTKYPNCPAVLIEIDFISNNDFARRCKERSYLRRIAKAIWMGIRNTEE